MSSFLPPGVHPALEGRPFFPCSPDKRPAFNLLPKGPDDKPTWTPFRKRLATPEEVTRWKGHRGPWAMPCGELSGFVALDFDGPEGLKLYEDRYDGAELPPTAMTPRGGYHTLHAYQEGVTVPNDVKIIPGLDVRSEGGYIVVPSAYQDGRTWIKAPNGTSYPLPAWFLEALKKKAPQPSAGGGANVAGLPPGVGKGERNATAARLAGRYIYKGLNAEETFHLLRPWAATCSPPFPDAELRSVVFSIARKEQEKSVQLEVIGAADLVQRSSEAREMLIRPFFPAGGKGYLAGNSGTGKTLLAENLSYSLANEIPLFGRFDVSRGNVLYVDSESTQELARGRVRKIRSGLNVAHAGVSFIFPDKRLDLGKQRNNEELCRLIDREKASLCILDSFLCFASLRNENDNTEVRNWLEEYISPIPKATGASVLILDHAAKASAERVKAGIGITIRGAGAKQDWADVVLTFEERKNELKFLRTLRFAKTRFCSPVPAMILEMDANLVFKPSGEEEICPIFTVRQMVEETPGIAAGALYKMLSSATGAAIRTAMRSAARATELGMVRREEKGNRVMFHPPAVVTSGDDLPLVTISEAKESEEGNLFENQ
jgi:AAA domain/Bifunctional DNA primase/polymerase, N-terminal/Primase C terminal 1 (PriCT-1)